MIHAYLRADPRGSLAGYDGHMHAKVMLTRTRVIVGSTNYTTGSQANEEVAVEVRISERGAALAHQHFLKPVGPGARVRRGPRGPASERAQPRPVGAPPGKGAPATGPRQDRGPTLSFGEPPAGPLRAGRLQDDLTSGPVWASGWAHSGRREGGAYRRGARGMTV